MPEISIPPVQAVAVPTGPGDSRRGAAIPSGPAADNEGLPPLTLTPDCALHVWCAGLVEDEEEGERGEEDMIYATATTVATPPPWWR